MATVVISPSNVVTFPDGGGHFWVYMQYALGLRHLGCELYWLEQFQSSGDQGRDAFMISTFLERMKVYGLGENVILYTEKASTSGNNQTYEYIGIRESEAEKLFQRTDLLLNFHYSIAPELLSRFKRTALLDIDPGLLQFWISAGQIVMPPHDSYFTIGETVGTPSAKFPDCGLPWIRIRPAVCLEFWPYVYDADSEAFTTISSWWGGAGRGEWITDGPRGFYENNKRVTFLQFIELPKRTNQTIELALCLGSGRGDVVDQRVLEAHEWRVREASHVASTPEMYQAYVQSSRGEFSCAKPSCMKFSNAWISDRTLCYLASGKPAVVQNTGPSSYLPSGSGLFRFSTMDEAVDALNAVNDDYERHCRAARELAEAHFDAKRVLDNILTRAL